MMFRPARHEPAIRAMERVRHGIQDRLHLSISRQEIRDHCSRSATEHTGTRAYPYKQHAPRSWSGTVEAISRSVAAYQRAAHATEQSACADIMNKLKRHAQALLQKCTPRAYLRECALLYPIQSEVFLLFSIGTQSFSILSHTKAIVFPLFSIGSK